MEQKCDKYSDNELFRYLQGNCMPDEVETIQMHIMSCDYCFDKISKMRRLSEILSEEKGVNEVDNVKLELSEKKEKRGNLFRPMLIGVSSAAAILAIAFIGYSKFNPSGTDIPIHSMPGTEYHTTDSVKHQKDSIIVIDEEVQIMKE